jgi:1-acyl-sn-glycerol-3-phosphate acyltransferase
MHRHADERALWLAFDSGGGGVLDRLRQFPREPDMLCCGVRVVAAVFIRAFVHLYHRLAVAGRSNLKIEGSFVIVANHCSHLDTLCLLSALPMARLNRAFPAAASDVFFLSRPRTALAVLAVNAMPFDRALHVRQSLECCEKLLARDGNILILYPEGTRSASGEIQPFRAGIGKLLAGRRIPVVPVYIDGAFEAWPRHCWLPRPRRVRLYVDEPRAYPMLPRRDCAAARWICEDLQRAVESLRRRASKKVKS